MEFYVTTSTDPSYLNYVMSNQIEVLYPSLADEIIRFQNGEISQLEVDPWTTLYMFPYTVAKGLTSNIYFNVEIVEINNAHPGADIEITVQTLPGAEVWIQLTYESGTVSAFPTDQPKTAGEEGTVYWTWNINEHIPPSTVTLTITAKLNGEEKVLVQELPLT